MDWYKKTTTLNKKMIENKKLLQNSTFAVATVSFLRLDAMHVWAERVFLFVRIDTNHQGGKGGGLAATLGPSRRGLPF